MKVFSELKRLCFRPGRRPFRVLSGAFRGLRMHLDPDFQTQYIIGTYEREVHGWLRRLSRGAASAIDVGAGDGEYTLYFLRVPTVRAVHAFEPNVKFRDRIHENLRLNTTGPDGRLDLSDRFVGDEDDRVHLDSLLERCPRPCVVKIDVDGWEGHVLNGARALARSGDVRWIVETHTPELETECLEWFRREGYRTHIIHNAPWRVFLPDLRESAFGSHNRWFVAYKPA